ncbi:MAG: hypothetical protein ACI4AE_02345 [Candidatus Cryptobacteroides sp.]
MGPGKCDSWSPHCSAGKNVVQIQFIADYVAVYVSAVIVLLSGISSL